MTLWVAAQSIAVDVESAIEAELVIERERGHERGGPEAARVQPGRERRNGLRDADPVVARAVARRIAAGQDRGVRRQRNGGRGVRAIEDRAAARERIDCRRAGARVAV